jgi:hypothetical protein
VVPLDHARKNGSAELLILAQLETRPRHGYEISSEIERRYGVSGWSATALIQKKPAARLSRVVPRTFQITCATSCLRAAFTRSSLVSQSEMA